MKVRDMKQVRIPDESRNVLYVFATEKGITIAEAARRLIDAGQNLLSSKESNN